IMLPLFIGDGFGAAQKRFGTTRIVHEDIEAPKGRQCLFGDCLGAFVRTDVPGNERRRCRDVIRPRAPDHNDRRSCIKKALGNCRAYSSRATGHERPAAFEFLREIELAGHAGSLRRENALYRSAAPYMRSSVPIIKERYAGRRKKEL